MIEFITNKMKSFRIFNLFLIFVVFSELLTLVFVSSFSLLFNGKVTYDYLLTGLFSGFCISGITFIFFIKILRSAHTIEKNKLIEILNKQQYRYKNLYEKSPSMIHSINKSGEIIGVSDSWLNYLGYSREEVVGKKSIEFLTEASRKYATEIAIPFFIKNGYSINIEYQFVKKSGEVIDVILSATSELDHEGNFENSIAVITDISERKRAEEREKDVLSLLESIVDNLPYFIFIKRASDLRFVLFNAAAEKFLGKSRHELIGKNDFDIFERDQAFKLTEKDREVLAMKGKIDTHEEQISTTLGKRIMKAKKLALLDENGEPKYLLGITEDITEEKLAELELQIFREDIKVANRVKSEFLTNMSHELRTPLNGVIGFSDILLKTDLNDTQKNYVNTIFRSANSLLQILNDILGFVSLEREKIELHIVKFSIHEFINQMVETIRFAALEKNIKLRISIKPDVPEFISADQIRLKQVFLNLLSNAVKFTENGEIEIKVEINESTEVKDSQEFIFLIRDTGIGIEKDQLSKVFKEFTQVDSSNKRVHGGAGLGLAISARILSLMNSSLEVITEPNKGSTFYFTIHENINPNIIQIEKGNLQEGRINPLIRNHPFRVLIADDDEINMFLSRTLVKEILPECEIFEAINGLEAVKYFQSSMPDIIFMDIQMPELNGYEATQEIRKLEPKRKIPIIALTAGTKPGDREKCLACGMNDYASKPVVRETFHGLIEKWISPEIKI